MPRRRQLIGSAAAVAVAAVVVIFAPKLPDFLRGNDRPQRADAVVALAGGSFTEPRLAEAIRLIQAGYATNLVVTGVEYDPSHPAFDSPAWDALRPHFGHLPITVDSRSAITRESARFVRELAQARGWTRVLVVTSEFHWRRSRALFRYECRAGPEVRVCTLPDVNFDRWWADPPVRRRVRNEYWFLLGFYGWHSTYGLKCLAGAALLAAATRAIRRKMAPRTPTSEIDR